MSDDSLSAVAKAAAQPWTPPPPKYVREESVETHFKDEVKKRKDRCMTEKHVSPGRRGVPDQLISWGYPLCIMELVELKAPKGPKKKHQQRDHSARAALGLTVHTLYTAAEVDEYFATMDHLMSLT